MVKNNIISLEGRVDDGGHMKVLKIENWIEEIIKYNSNLKYNSKNMISELKKWMDALVQKKIVTERNDHPLYGENIWIFKYSKKVFYDHLWGSLTEKENHFLELARGLVLDKEWAVVSYPFEKIFNYWEKIWDWKGKEIEIKLNKGNYQFIEKLNGFLGVISPNPFDSNRLIVHTQGSLATEENHMYNRYIIQLLSEKQKNNLLNYFKNNGKFTLMFEVIHKEDPHIVSYKENEYGLKLIWARNIEWNDYKNMNLLSEDELDVMGKEIWFDRPKHFIDSIENILSSCDKIQNFEGYMVRDINTWKHLVKIKTAFYLITKFLSRMNEWNYKFLFVDKDKFIESKWIEEEFFPIVDYIHANKSKFEFATKEEKLKLIQDFISSEFSTYN